LNKLRNETNTTTKEGQAQLTALNAKLDQNNEYIKENADQYLKQKINIGNYSESVKDALASLNPFNGGLSGFTQRAQEAGGAGNLLKNAFMQITTGIWGMVKSSLAFIATPIGAIIAAIVVVATTMYNIFKSFTPIVDKVEQIFAGLSATLSVVKNTIISIVTGAKSLGSAFSGLSGDMDKAYNSAVALKKAQQDLDDAMQATELSSAKARAEINKLNIQAKDRTKTEAERLALLQRAENLEKTVFNEIETNGTIVIDQPLFDLIDQINCSPKLSNSGMTEKQRINPDAIKRIMEHSNYTFKFVISNEEDIKELFRDFVVPFSIPLTNVVCMPGLDSQTDFHERTQFVLEMAKKYRFRGLTRLHISAWDKTLNV
jgi:hypothetical protein